MLPGTPGPGGPLPNGPLWQPSPTQPNPPGHIPGLHIPGTTQQYPLGPSIPRPSRPISALDSPEAFRKKLADDAAILTTFSDLAAQVVVLNPPATYFLEHTGDDIKFKYVQVHGRVGLKLGAPCPLHGPSCKVSRPAGVLGNRYKRERRTGYTMSGWTLYSFRMTNGDARHLVLMDDLHLALAFDPPKMWVRAVGIPDTDSLITFLQGIDHDGWARSTNSDSNLPGPMAELVKSQLMHGVVAESSVFADMISTLRGLCSG